MTHGAFSCPWSPFLVTIVDSAEQFVRKIRGLPPPYRFTRCVGSAGAGSRIPRRMPPRSPEDALVAHGGSCVGAVRADESERAGGLMVTRGVATGNAFGVPVRLASRSTTGGTEP